MTTALAVYDEDTAAFLESMASPADMTAASSPDVLKINYDEDSIHPRGVWVLGQKKKDGAITEQGSVVDKVVILAARCRYSYYHEATGEAVSTMIFEAGSQPPDKAEADAKVAALNGKLKFQIVLFGMAIVDGAFKEFISYQGGSAYKPVSDHIKDLSIIITPTKKISAPLFAHLTILGPTVKDRKGAVTFFIPTFEKGQLMTRDQLGFFGAKRDDVVAYIEHVNSMAKERKDKGVKAAPPAAGPSSTMYAPPAAADPFADLGKMKRAGSPPSTGDDVPFDMPGSAPSATPAPSSAAMPVDDDGYDIEAAMAAILSK